MLAYKGLGTVFNFISTITLLQLSIITGSFRLQSYSDANFNDSISSSVAKDVSCCFINANTSCLKRLLSGCWLDSSEGSI